MGIITWIVFGFVVGLIARALMPGRQKLGLIWTTLLGVAHTRNESRGRQSPKPAATATGGEGSDLAA